MKNNSFLRMVLVLALLLIEVGSVSAQSSRNFNVIAYYFGGPSGVNLVNPRKITHIIYCFYGLKGNKLYVRDDLTVKKLVGLKKQNPKLKVLLSLGGWGGCPTCSDVFLSPVNRKAFAESVKKECDRLGADGIDLDWEYPAIEGAPGDKYTPEDKNTFTLLVQQLRQTLGNRYEISFAAGGFQKFLENSIDWVPVMKAVDRVHIMSYDLVNGYSTITGHHTALYSTPQLKESTDNAVNYLLNLGIPSTQVVIGAAFYARVWKDVANINNGLYQPGVFRNTVALNQFLPYYTKANGYTSFWDEQAQAPYLYNADRKLFVTFDNQRSVRLKAEYVINKNLNGIMFWQIAHDMNGSNSLLGTINDVIRENKKKNP